MIISIILVIKFGIIGVALGTLIAMIIRTTEFLIYASKHILERSITECIIRVLITSIQVILVCIINLIFLNSFKTNTYFDWIIYAIIVATIASIVVISMNFVIYKKDFKEVIKTLKNMKN